MASSLYGISGPYGHLDSVRDAAGNFAANALHISAACIRLRYQVLRQPCNNIAEIDPPLTAQDVARVCTYRMTNCSGAPLANR